LWNLSDQDQLKRSFEWSADIFRKFGLEVPPLEIKATPTNPNAEGTWVHKRYLSLYLDFEKREKMTQDCFQVIQQNIWLQTQLLDWNFDPVSEIFTLWLKKMDQDRTMKCKRLILAGGRYLPLSFKFQEEIFLR
jgi:hypothetical protein